MEIKWRKTAMLFTLIMLTQLDGSPIWVESSAIVIVKQTPSGAKHHQCPQNSHSLISVQGKGLCLQDTEDEIRKKIDAVKGDGK